MPISRSQAPSPSRASVTTRPANRSGMVLPLLALAAILGVIFFLQLRHFAPFITDDTFISLRYSERFLHGKGLTWNDFPPAVEGYTNLLWVLLCAGMGALGMPLPFAAQMLGVVSTIALLAAVAAQAFRDYPAKIRFLAALLGSGALVLSGPVDLWAQGGLEQPLLAALLAWTAYFGVRWVATTRPARRDTVAMGLLLGFACLTRADAALFTAAFFLGAVLADGVRVPSIVSRARLLPIPILFSLAQLFFRRIYYHEWLPNTAYVKVAFTLHRLRTGLKYEFVGLETNLAFFLLAFIGAVALWIAGKQRTVKLLVTVVVAWLLYIVIVGGDIFPSVRHFIPALAIAAFLISGCGLLTLSAPFRFSRPRLAAFLVLLALVLVSDHFCEPETWEAQGKSIGLFLKDAFGEKHPLLVSDAAGVVPYYSQLPALDPLGLNDYHIARHKAQERGKGWLGHELADGQYVLDHRPDLLLFSTFQSDINFPSDQEIAHDPRFARYYQPVRFDTDPPDAIRTVLYVRRIDGPLGISVSPGRVVVPAYLAVMNAANSVKLIGGKAQLVLPPHGSATFLHIPVTAGKWKAEVDGGGAAEIAVRALAPAQAVSGCAACIQQDQPSEVNLSVQNTSDQPAIAAAIRLSQQAGSATL